MTRADDDARVPDELGDPATWPTGTLVATAGRLVEAEWNRRLAALGITSTGVGVLIALADLSRSQIELAHATRVSGQSMGRTIDRLERAGLVARQAHETDRRRTLVHRTESGTRMLHSALSGGGPGAASVFDQLPDPDRFRADLIRLIGLLDRPT